jgi:hypothetical protein
MACSGGWRRVIYWEQSFQVTAPLVLHKTYLAKVVWNTIDEVKEFCPSQINSVNKPDQCSLYWGISDNTIPDHVGSTDLTSVSTRLNFGAVIERGKCLKRALKVSHLRY